jgi:NitT/TauT family transport system substrate-binding protein
VQLTAYDHASSLEAFSAGRADAVAASNADVLVGRSLGSPCTVVAVTSVHVGGETLFARRDVKSVADLRGKTIGVELGQPEHLALEHALEAAELTTAEVRLVNIVPEVAHREFASRSLHAVMVPGAAAKTLPKRLPSVRELETARSPSLVYGVLCVRPGSLAARRGEWTQVVRAWEDAAANPSRSSSGNASTRLVATPDPQLREALMTATEVFDAFHVRTRAYPEAVFHAFSSNDIAWL